VTHPLTKAFYREFEKLLPEERKAAIEDMQDFVEGYLDGKAEVDAEIFDDPDGSPRVQGEASADTLAEMMNDMGIMHGHVNRGRA
jgi:hypothetical protein